MAKLFFSYSHKDEELRNELEVHLAALRRQGLIEPWHDRRIGPGENIEHSISEHLDSADIILLLVSADFIASDYCYDIEVQRALQRHDAGEAIVVPVILRPCDWHHLPFGKLLATPTDGKPVSKFASKDDALLEVSRSIRKCSEQLNSKFGLPSLPTQLKTPSEPQQIRPRSSNLRVKKTFTDREKQKFKTDAFDYIANYFDSSLLELEARNQHIETDFRRIDANQFTASIFVRGTEVSTCTISFGNRSGFVEGITYSAGTRSGGGFNESLSVTDDGYVLLLRPLGMFSFGKDRDITFSHQGAAEYYWEMLIRPLQ